MHSFDLLTHLAEFRLIFVQYIWLRAGSRLATAAGLLLPVVEVHFLQEFDLFRLVFDIVLQDGIFD